MLLLQLSHPDQSTAPQKLGWNYQELKPCPATLQCYLQSLKTALHRCLSDDNSILSSFSSLSCTADLALAQLWQWQTKSFNVKGQQTLVS